MAIETNCPGCGRKLRVADEHAGKTARCPVCKTLYTVPQSSGAATPVLPERAASAPREHAEAAAIGSESAPSGPQTAKWRLKTENGQVYGPVAKTDLDAWVAQGRVTPNAELQQEGDAFWQRAANLYPELALSHAPLDNPFAEYDMSGGPNPYEASRAYGVSTEAYRENHRGVLILILGLLTWILGCPILGPVAVVMGLMDLRKMNEGTMDPAGKGMTIAGAVLGGIYTAMMVLIVVFVAIAAMMD